MSTKLKWLCIVCVQLRVLKVPFICSSGVLANSGVSNGYVYAEMVVAFRIVCCILDVLLLRVVY